jgi:hypothetical protein
LQPQGLVLMAHAIANENANQGNYQFMIQDHSMENDNL